MDSFAENQMGRDDGPVTPVPGRRRAKSREYVTSSMGADQELSVVGSEHELLAVSGDVLVHDDVLGASAAPLKRPKDAIVQLPYMSTQESALIAARWERKKSAFMPVGDPYAEPDRSTPYVRQWAQEYCTCSSICAGFVGVLRSKFPIIEWLPRINRSSLYADVIAGVTVGVMLIPQSMSYANIAGLDYIYGLYTSVLPIIIYSLMGTSRQLGVGPVAMISLLVEVGLKGALTEEQCPAYYAQAHNSTVPEADWDLQADLCPDQYARLAFLTSFLVGVFQVSWGFLRLGFLVSFLAHPVVSGFTSAAAIIIGLSQIQYFLGYKVPKSQYVYETIGHIFDKIDEIQWEQLLFGLTWWFMLSMSRRLATKYKKRLGWLRPSAPLIACLLAIVVGSNVKLFNGCGFPTNACTNATNTLIVGQIPSGVGGMYSANLLDFSQLSTVLSTALSCAIIGYMESIAISKSLASKHKYEVDAGQELIALGVANLLGSISSSYPVTGSFSRSAVNNQVGAQTQLSGMITGFLLLLTLLFLTDYFYFLPKFALAAIVIASVTNLVDYKEAIHLWKVKKQDCALWGVAFLGTLFLGVQVGLLLAIAFSLVLVIIESVRPQMTVLWRLPGSQIYRNIKQESAGHFVPGVMIVRIGASMYFANVAFIRDYVSKMVAEFSEAADTAGDFSKRWTSATAAGADGSQAAGATSGAPPDGTSPRGASPPSLRGGSSPAAAAFPVEEAEAVAARAAEPIRYIVFEMTPVISVDSTALHMLEDMHRDLKDRGIRLAFSTIGNRVEDTLKRSGLIDKMGSQWVHPSVHSAVQHCIRHQQQMAAEATEAADERQATSTHAQARTAAEKLNVVVVEAKPVSRSEAPDGVVNRL